MNQSHVFRDRYEGEGKFYPYFSDFNGEYNPYGDGVI